MIEYLSIVSIVLILVLVYYVKSTVDNVISSFSEVKTEVQSSLGELEYMKNDITSKISLMRRELEQLKSIENTEVDEYESWKIKSLEQKISKLEKAVRENLTQNGAKKNSLLKELNILKTDLRHLKEKLYKTQEAFQKEFDILKEKVKEDLIKEITEEIEMLEEMIEEKKDRELQEFMEVLTFSINLEPERLQKGLSDLKKGLLSLRDAAKVYVLTEKGQEEFYKLRDDIVELLKNLRKIAVVSHPEEEIYRHFRKIIVEIKRLELPMKIERNGRIVELNPEKSFIEIHHRIYLMIEEVDRIAKMLDTPIPITPIEKEFYEKLNTQFKELKQLEMQLEKIMSRLGQKNIADPTTRSQKELENLLQELEF